MNDRLLRWVSAGVLTAGMSCVVLVGAGIAIAEPSSGTSPGPSASSQSEPEAAGDTGASADDAAEEAAGGVDPENTDVTEDEDVVDDTETEDVTEEVATEDDAVAAETTDDETLSGSGHHATTDTDADTEPTSALAAVVNEVEAPEQSEEPTQLTEPTEPTEPTVETATADSKPSATTGAVDQAVRAFEPEQKSAVTQIAMVAPAAQQQAPARPSLINIIGTLAWSVIDFMVKLIVGPPAVPPGSTVSAGRSTLQIDCGDGYTADADWYYPKEGQPDKFIYFQHGFMAHAGIYNLTLAELAERNNAIVVAPTITSNYFACDGCSLTADPMHAAVAGLFEDDRDALLASARAAGFEGTLPDKFVFAGQSAGSMLAAGAAGYFYDGAAAEQKADLAGVLLYDGSAANGALGRALDKLPSSVPVLQVAAAPSVINYGGGANNVLTEKRPGQFNGVQLIGGAHSDAFRSDAYFGLVQAFVGLVFGWSTPNNVEAVQVLSQGWLTDMYAGRVYDPATRTGIYGDPGQPGQTVIDIPTDAGPARGYVLPGPPASLSPIEWFFAGLLHSINSNDFAACSTEPAATGSCAGAAAV
ncbi:hypothetical protein H7I53_00760 [Mycolicibacterium pulveris]|uniref:Alpha/beta hydrolase n=1 Tax=Mycolicibacterium pulveris TaxID=36813 RepID=A0A7I7UIR2_MYCPV|nr:hypothetical protein [Mycolicibacterium pulveris]MCV6978755.1 hypothetical protein [Mycolicibacterium pulveris]BBY80046.1 hypothetical protein MPUL_12040 [Mycolicibacterium pulveris]